MDTPPIVKARVQPAPAVSETRPQADKAVPAEVNTKGGPELYATYGLDHEVPFLAEYYGIKDVWNNKELTYKQEIDTIDNYLMGEIKDKQLENKTTAVKERLSKLESIAGIDPTASVAMRMKQLAAYAQYMQKLNNIDLGVRFHAQQPN